MRAAEATQKSTSRRAIRVMFSIALMILPTAASAHVDGTMHGHFAAGFTHPLFGADHVLAMLAVGIWATQLGGRSIWALPGAFLIAMAAGGLLGIAGFQISYAELGIGASVVMLGVAVALAWKAHQLLALAIVATFAALHGYAHGLEIPSAASPAAYTTGFVLATALIHATGVALGLVLRRPMHGILPKAAGVAIMASGAVIVMG